ncbi:MAG: hypothetical protein M3Z35_05715, partial [Nitrospirota bacterium]|nr:hypothetical protein [Nitrospirota bacterium]
EDMYKSQGASMFTDKFSHLKRCEQKGSDGTSSLVLETRIETYNFCPSDPSIFFSPKEPLMNWEPPDSIE